ncbi:MAG: glycosyltransferase family 2 protein, partial [Lachnospiraceae bacterium]|nr:glycosyltransferase family 2 protein [Lachnospiraceae bacterium]
NMTGYLLRKGNALQIPGMIVNNGFKYIGYQLGKHYKLLPMWVVRKVTMNPKYWEKSEIL